MFWKKKCPFDRLNLNFNKVQWQILRDFQTPTPTTSGWQKATKQLPSDIIATYFGSLNSLIQAMEIQFGLLGDASKQVVCSLGIDRTFIFQRNYDGCFLGSLSTRSVLVVVSRSSIIFFERTTYIQTLGISYYSKIADAQCLKCRLEMSILTSLWTKQSIWRCGRLCSGC